MQLADSGLCKIHLSNATQSAYQAISERSQRQSTQTRARVDEGDFSSLVHRDQIIITIAITTTTTVAATTTTATITTVSDHIASLRYGVCSSVQATHKIHQCTSDQHGVITVILGHGQGGWGQWKWK